MVDFGVTPTGFVRKTQQEILDEIRTQQLAEIDAALDVGSDQPVGQINGIFSRQLGILWEIAEVCYNANDPDSAEDFLLTALCKLTGTERRAASYSKVTATVDLDDATQLLSDTHFASVDGQADNRWTPEADYTAVGDGLVPVVFRAENTGEIEAPSGTLTVIATPVAGWNSITNDGDAVAGRNIDDDPTLRERREAQLTASGSSTVDAIRADVLEIDEVEDCTVFENKTASIDANGLPPHSFEVLIFDPDGMDPETDDAVAQVIWDSKAGGIRAFGSTSGTAIDDLGVNQTVPFSRVDQKNVYLEFDLVTATGYVGAAAVKAYVVQQANDRFDEAGEDVLAVFLKALPLNLTGVGNVTALRLGFAASPVGTADLSIGVRELARFDTSRILVNGA